MNLIYQKKVYLVLVVFAITLFSFSAVLAATEFGGNSSAAGSCGSDHVTDCHWSLSLSDSSYEAYSASINSTVNYWNDTDDGQLDIYVCLVKANGVNYACNTLVRGKVWPSASCPRAGSIMSDDGGNDNCTSFGGTVGVDPNGSSAATWATYHLRVDSVYTSSQFSIAGRRDGSTNTCVPSYGTGDTPCNSPANSCSMTNPGTTQCDGSCSASSPPDSSCPSGYEYQSPSSGINGRCSGTHYNCSAGSLGATAEYPDQYQWWCNGTDGGTNMLCSESKTDNPTTCQDSNANNFGGALPCTYGGGYTYQTPYGYPYPYPYPYEYPYPYPYPTPYYSVTVVKTNGGGTVKSTDNIINCGGTCSHDYIEGSSVNLNATPTSSYWKFTGWSGDCSGTGVCALNNITSPKTVTPNFNLRQFIYQEF